MYRSACSISCCTSGLNCIDCSASTTFIGTVKYPYTTRLGSVGILKFKAPSTSQKCTVFKSPVMSAHFSSSAHHVGYESSATYETVFGGNGPVTIGLNKSAHPVTISTANTSAANFLIRLYSG